MCGFAGVFGSDRSREQLEHEARRMAHAIRHRGPDSDGIWSYSDARIAMAHCRLAILDLTPAGNQPMLSQSGRYVLAFNGEIYNFADIKRELEEAGSAPPWRGHSDTEALLAAIDAWGLQDALTRAVGMFAIALYDRQNRKLSLVRDRFGEKPLYYGRQGDHVLFASELQGITAYPDWHGEIDRGALALYLRYGHVPAPYSIYAGIRKVPPGTIIEFGPGLTLSPPVSYWDVSEVAARAADAPFLGTADDATSEIEPLLETAVRGQMISDVPLGAFLSGGIDSSLIVATMQKASKQPVRTFTIGFSSADYDESPHALAIARHLGTDHTELMVTPDAARSLIPDLPGIYAEPFADASAIPTLLVSRLARNNVTVALSGDGGDEIFSGYDRYRVAEGALAKMHKLPTAIREPASAALRNVPAAWLEYLPGGSRNAPRLRKLADVMEAGNTGEAYRALVSHWPEPNELVIGGNEPALSRPNPPAAFDAVKCMMFSDLTGYLPDDVLTKVDRASMSVGLEVRVPYLDHRLAEFALSLPSRILRNAGTSKWLLRELLAKHVPRALFERPKMGFSVPIAEWLRGPLKSWASDLLAPSRLERDGLLRATPITAAWNDHLARRADLSQPLWTVLMFQAWRDAQQAGRAA